MKTRTTIIVILVLAVAVGLVLFLRSRSAHAGQATGQPLPEQPPVVGKGKGGNLGGVPSGLLNTGCKGVAAYYSGGSSLSGPGASITSLGCGTVTKVTLATTKKTLEVGASAGKAIGKGSVKVVKKLNPFSW